MIDATTSLFAVIGNPVSHSLSPAMHNAAFAHTGYNGVYCAMEVTDIGAAMVGVRALNIGGASITIPHKIDVMEHIDEIDPMARDIGAVNTIANRGGRLCGYNSDGLGAVKALTEAADLKDKAVTIIGAGGAARAIGFALAAEGGRVTIVNRSVDSGERLATDLGSDFRSLADVATAGLACDILINTTPVGMVPDIDAMPVNEEHLGKHMVVMDIVYNPLRTRLLRSAYDRGCITIDGVAMFVHQGAFQFELWTGMAAPIDVMEREVLSRL